MIVRIMAEDQYRLDDSHLAQIEQLDEVMEQALNNGDEAAFQQALRDLIASIKENGQVVPVDEIVTSDLIVPAHDMTLAEARSCLHHANGTSGTASSESDT